ncbi:ASKHA domain-containing protein [Gehongia tenuis]|uniref:DUF4445 domain-containing protein n=1 Tax=Gehongia tenuis TaxID=2763655 RepID=A0A926HPQ2_9FIRM|nr:ASKHA domain-containing protein [Gehongia tenuis]MBC8531453.1 DUF4445 domain-containing protein [Gehongia tenuis]
MRKNFRFRVDSGRVEALAGEGHRPLIEAELAKAAKYIHPTAVYKRLTAESWRHGELPQELAECQSVAPYVLTVGEECTDQMEEAFEKGEYVRALIVDHIASLALSDAYEDLMDYLDEASQVLVPGDNCPLEQQRTILSLLGTEEIGVGLTEGLMLTPGKSLSGILGFGGTGGCRHSCKDCDRPCGYRRVPVELISGGRIETLTAQKGESLLNLLRRHGVRLAADCGGMGRCGKCRVKAWGLPPSLEDRKFFSAAELAEGWRLACTAKVNETAKVVVEPDREPEVLMEDGMDEADIDPPVCWKKTPGILNVALEVAREEEGMYLIRNGCAVERGTGASHYGLAVDVGTTTLAVYLVDLKSGKTMAKRGGSNPQRTYGADVMSRIQRANEGDLEPLSAAVRQEIVRLAEEVCFEADLKLNRIVHTVAAGNTAMTHLLLGLPCRSLGQAPYRPRLLNGVEMEGKAVGLPGRYVTVLPGVGGMVGSDIAAGMVACGMDEAQKPSMLVDLGTNGEIVLGDGTGFVACAAAAGPAFEGAGLSQGMAALPGAIVSVGWNGALTVDTVQREAAIGICGSGALDGLAALKRAGALDESGRLAGERFELAAGVFLTQKDVRQLQLAKGALRAGIEMLLERLRMRAEDVETLWLAGGFGSRLNAKSAAEIGLIPAALEQKVRFVGNGSAAGAKRCLLSRSAMARIGTIQQRTRSVELAGESRFQNVFMKHMALKRC